MAIGRVPGAALLPNLDRQGLDLQFTSESQTLLYFDFANFRLGVNTATPTQALEVNGNVLVANNILFTANLTSDLGNTSNWVNTVYANTIQSTSLAGTLLTNAQPNVTSLGILSSLEVTGDLITGNIQTTGQIELTGNIQVDVITANSIVGTISTASQPNITEVGNITDGTWSANLGNISGATLYDLTAGNIIGTLSSTVLGNSTVYIGTTAIELNRSSNVQTLSGVSIDGSAGSVSGDQIGITAVGVLANLTISDFLDVGNVQASYVSGVITTADQPYITNLANVVVDSLSTTGNVEAAAVDVTTVYSTDVYGTIRTVDQPYISNLGNISVDSITIAGNTTLSGNTSGGIINADELYESNNRVVTEVSTINISGDVSGSGNISDIQVELSSTGVTAGTYGAADDETWDRIPKITVDSKGRITNIANITLTQVGNVTFTDTTVSTTANLTIAPDNGYIFANNSIISNVANPESAQDVVTVDYLTSQLSAASGQIVADDSQVVVNDDGINPGNIEITVDGTITANITAATSKFYNTVEIGDLAISGNAILSAGNIVIDAQSTGIVQIAGTDAIWIPAGDTSSRPDYPQTGYVRFNTETDNIEYYTGNSWTGPGASIVTSEAITPNGVDDTYALSAIGTTTDGVLVSINGTMQQPYTAYSITNDEITFTEVPAVTDIIEIRALVTGSTVTASQLRGGDANVILSSGNVNVSGNLIPFSDVTFDIGSADKQWRDLFLSGNTIHLGGATLSTDGNSLSFTPAGGDAIDLSGDTDPASISSSASNVRVTANHVNVSISSSNVASFSAAGLTVTGNVTASYIIGNGSLLTGMPETYTNSNVAAYLPTYTGTLGGNLAVASLVGTLPISQGGTGGTSSSAALNNLLPSGEISGYVLKTAGEGSYYWAAETGAGSTVGTTISTSRVFYTATAGQTLFENAGTYTPGAGQLRIFINGVRQFDSAYTETSNTSFTLSAGVSSGTEVMAEVDGYTDYTVYASDVVFSNVGGLSSTTVQDALAELDLEKAALTGAEFTGNVSTTGNLNISSKLGIGGTLNSWNSSSYVTQFPGGALESYLNAAFNVYQNLYRDNNNTNRYVTANPASWYNQVNGTHNFYVVPSGTAGGSATTFTNALSINNSGNVTISASSASTSTTTGALQVAGGVGIAGDVTAGNVTTTNFQGTTATLSGNVSAGNVSSTYYTGTLLTSSQPSITSLGTVTGLTSSGTVQSSANVGASLGSSTVWWNFLYANTHVGTSASFSGTVTAGTLSGSISSSQVTTALGYTPYNATNPNGYISSVPNSNTQLLSLGVGVAFSGVSGEIRAGNNITAYYSSDARLKENVRDIPNALDKVSAIGGKLFAWTDNYIASHGGEDAYFLPKESFGVIAQDVEQVFPEAVRTRDDGYLAVDYEKMCALAFQAIKELQQQVQLLEQQIKDK